MLRTVQVHNKEGDPALILNQIDSTLSWLSILHGEARFHTIRINKPDLTIRRDTEGIIHVAGLHSARIRVRAASLTGYCARDS